MRAHEGHHGAGYHLGRAYEKKATKEGAQLSDVHVAAVMLARCRCSKHGARQTLMTLRLKEPGLSDFSLVGAASA